MNTEDTPDIGEEAIPAEFPGDERGGEADVDDEPMGVPADAPDDGGMPGIPEGDEPPDAG